MINVGLFIIVEPAAGKGVTLAKVADRQLLHEAAVTALCEAREKAEAMATEDELLGALQQQEVTRLYQALQLVIPDLRFAIEAASKVM